MTQTSTQPMNQSNGLRALRLERGWSQEHLAMLSGLSERTIQRAERGDSPSLDTLAALAASFDLSSAQMREILITPQETQIMAANGTSQTQSNQPLLSLAHKRLLLAGGAYLAAMTALIVAQRVLGWDPELLPFAGFIGAGLLASYAYFKLGGDEKKKADE